MGRAAHHLGLLHIAAPYYRRALEAEPPPSAAGAGALCLLSRAERAARASACKATTDTCPRPLLPLTDCRRRVRPAPRRRLQPVAHPARLGRRRPRPPAAAPAPDRVNEMVLLEWRACPENLRGPCMCSTWDLPETCLSPKCKACAAPRRQLEAARAESLCQLRLLPAPATIRLHAAIGSRGSTGARGSLVSVLGRGLRVRALAVPFALRTAWERHSGTCDAIEAARREWDASCRRRRKAVAATRRQPTPPSPLLQQACHFPPSAPAACHTTTPAAAWQQTPGLNHPRDRQQQQLRRQERRWRRRPPSSR